jgi:hypothetical protein
MGKLTRAEYRRIFEESAATPFDNAHEAHWISLTKELLSLPPSHLEAVHETLKQGRWRDADDPRSYVKTVARREAIKMKIANYPDEHLHLRIPAIQDENGRQLSHDEYIDYLSYDGGPVKEGGVWYSRDSDTYDEDEHGPEGELLSRRGRLTNRIPDDLKTLQELPEDIKMILDEVNSESEDFHISTDAISVPDWGQIAAKAGLDETEIRVLGYKRHGVSRERALGLQATDPERRKLQAAWKRFDRNCIAKLRMALNKNDKKSGS